MFLMYELYSVFEIKTLTYNILKIIPGIICLANYCLHNFFICYSYHVFLFDSKLILRMIVSIIQHFFYLFLYE